MNRTGIIIGFLAAGVLAAAQTRVVDPNAALGDFTSIQEAIDASWHGDTILIRPGVYKEDLHFSSRAVTLTGTDPDDPNIVRSTVIHGTVRFDFLEGPDTVLTGLSLSGGRLIPVCTENASQENPAVDGSVVVWQDKRSGNSDIYGYDLETGTEFPVCTSTPVQTAPAVHGSIVVWQDYRGTSIDIYGYDLETETEFAVSTAAGSQSNPVVSDRYIIWEDKRNGNTDIYGCDLETLTEFAVCTDSTVQQLPAISGSLVVWEDARNGNWDIYGYDLETGQEFPICTQAASQESPALDGNLIVWQDYRNGDFDIYGFDRLTQAEFPVCELDGTQDSPAVSGRIVAWRDVRDGNYDIYGCDLDRQSVFPICTKGNIQAAPVLAGSIAVWQDYLNGYYDLYGVAIDPVPAQEDIAVGISCLNASPTVSKCLVSGFSDTGILCRYGADPLITGCRVRYCEKGISGEGGQVRQTLLRDNNAGLYRFDGHVEGCTIRNNQTAGVFQGEGLVRNNRVIDNRGWGLYDCGGSIEGNEIADNEYEGIKSCLGEIRYNTISDNWIGVDDCNSLIVGNDISENVNSGLFGCFGEIRGNLITANGGEGVRESEADVINNTILGNRGSGVYLCEGAVKNNIIAWNGQWGIYGLAENRYNCFYRNTGGSFYGGWAQTGDFYGDPLFAADGFWDEGETPDNTDDDVWVKGDYHLRSEAGRWEADSQGWITDARTSPCVDAGDPEAGPEWETNPNGNRVNVGRYGDTAEASRSPLGDGQPPQTVCVSPPAADLDGDCRVTLADFALFSAEWMACGLETQDACYPE